MQTDHIKKHTYPRDVTIFILTLITLFCYVTIRFFFVEYQKHYYMRQLLQKADSFMGEKEYFRAIKIYLGVMKEHSLSDTCRKKLIQSCFGLSTHVPNYYSYGLRYLEQKKYDKKDIQELACYIENQDFKDHFLSLFKKA